MKENNVVKLEQPVKRRKYRRRKIDKPQKKRGRPATVYVPGDRLWLLLIESLDGNQRLKLWRALVKIANA